ncbi:MAG: hypothetical protein Q9164_002147 [Protoblastenia rupestris]
MHGTGTQWGDFTEIQSITDVFGHGRTKDNLLVDGAVKANVGHGGAAAGVTSLIKAVMMFRKGLIPPQPGMPFQTNTKFPPLDKMNIKIAADQQPFRPSLTGNRKRKLLLNNFDASGGYTCLILEDAPSPSQKGRDPRMHHVVVCSARTSGSLKENQRRLLQYLSVHPESKVSDIAYTTTARRMHAVFRSSYVGQTSQDLTRHTSRDLEDTKRVTAKPEGSHSRVVFSFTGQGSLYAEMGRQLYETSSRFWESILSCQKLCVSQGLPPVAELIADGNADTKAMTVVQQQITTVVLEIALADLWRSWAVQPDLLIGHSLGEYAALCISGVLSVSDTLHLVGRRASMMEQQCTPGYHAMLAVGASVGSVEKTLAAKGFGSCEIACRNAPDMTVVSGTVEDLTNLHQILQAAKIKAKFLSVPYAFHSTQVNPILTDLEASARGVHFSKPLIPITSTLTGDVISSAGTFTPTYVKRQAREQVIFVGTLRACESKGFVDDHTLWIEIGPEPVCLGMIRSTIGILPRRLLPTIRSGEENWATIASSVAAMYLQDLLAPAADQILPIPETLPEKQRLTITCLQNIEKESWEGDKATFTFSAYTSEPRLFDAIQGHLVDHTAICPASVFCDMALTAANYIYRKTKPDKSVPEMSLWALEIAHPLVVGHCNPEQMVEVTAVKGSHDEDIVRISFKSKERSSYHEHGSCKVRFGKNDECKTTFSRTLHLVKKTIMDLTKSAAAGSCHRLQRSVVYKLFAEVVDYSDKYQGIEEVFLDDEHGDAAARIKLRPSAGTGDFTESPYWIDEMVHLAGFVLNGNVKNTNETLTSLLTSKLCISSKSSRRPNLTPAMCSYRLLKRKMSSQAMLTFSKEKESDKADKFLKIVASQSGYEIADMKPSTLFSDMV